MELYNPGAAFHYTSEWNPTRTHPVTGQVRPHRGEDWGAPAGTSIPAAGAGKVVYKGTMNGYGNLVVLEHANGTEIVHTLYAHMSAPSPLALGASVAKGATVGPCGNTGIGTGAHLHFEVLRNGTKGQPNLALGHATVNPRGFDISNLTHPDGVSPAAPAPAPAEAVAAGGAWQFPIRKAGGSPFKDAEELFAALEKETSGHYLLGSHKFWHGGIHISDQSAPQCVREEPVRCIGNGVVVAYRLNKDYLTSEFAGAEATQTLKYSNSFCLVRHDYKSPPNTEVQPGTSNELTFYSLYMHLLPFERYPVPQDEIPAPRIKMIASGFRARSDVKGATDCKEYGAISAGAEIEILEEHADRVHAKGKLIKGAVGGRTEGQEFWFAYKQNGASYPKSDGTPSWQEVVPPERTKPGYWKGKVRAVVTASGLTLRQPPASLTHGAPAGQPISAATTQGTSQGLVLCTNSTIEFDSAKVLNLKIGPKTVRMAECTFIPSTSGPTTGLKGHSMPVPASFWACVEDVSPNRFVQWQELTPTVFDVVVPMDTAIKAGDPIGYQGLNENIAGPTGGVSSKHQVHVEVFSADPRIEDFLKNKAGVKEGKQYIHLTADTKLNKKAPETGQIDLKKEHAVDLTKAIPFKDTVDWYEVSVLDENVTKTGLIKKSEAKLITQHDWEKLGFRVIKEQNTNADGFLDPDDIPGFFKGLYDSLDKFGNSDGKVTSDDLTQALKNSELRDQWSNLVAYHPTEWKDSADSPKWSRLTDLLKDSPSVLEHERKRIDGLIFWKDVVSQSAPFNEGVLWHLHPIAFVNNLLSVSCIPLDKAKEIALLVSSGYEGKSKLDYEALADNFDGQGMSFGVIQWNFGQGTLGPVLLEMRAANQAVFDSCFGANMNFQALLNSLTSANKADQMNWAVGIIASNRAGWKSAFKKIGEVEAFQKIQLNHAAKYNSNIVSCVKLMRELSPNLMEKVELRTYCALYDLCVQQNNLAKAEELIRSEFPSANITSQKELLIFVCRKRAEKAATKYRADAFSRRMGIITGQTYPVSMSGESSARTNTNYNMIIEGHVCDF
ncbi:M23 family metallopeptidase [Pseudomonas viridiflava]|uniref:M23 family metallopeptidase n=1 Tax=Pseudomonas viridiflava TaxID=33069 RepID=UPI001BCCE72A|nr:M23 family metallopeptidase [Pseudomonas viridiflava]QVI86081.1 M23 family metallopeptidase [Pseudomonas viridiflava]